MQFLPHADSDDKRIVQVMYITGKTVRSMSERIWGFTLKRAIQIDAYNNSYTPT